MNKAKVMIVTISGNPQQWLEARDLLCQLHSTTEIPGMPYFINRLKKFAKLLAKHPMCIRYQTYIHILTT
jgi:hypothetical protein